MQRTQLVPNPSSRFCKGAVRPLLIQDGNQDLVSNPDWEEAIRDWRTVTMTRDEFVSQVGTVWFANPVNPVTFSE